MSAYWYIDGTVRPKDGVIKKAIAVMEDYDCEYTQLGDGTIEMRASLDDMDSYADDLATALAPLMQDGDMDAKNDDISDGYYRYVFHDGQYDVHPGTPFVYYSGDPDDFVEQLPDEIVQAVLHKYASTASAAPSMKTTMNLSTAHLRPSTRAWMEDHVDDHPWYSTQGGFFIPTTKMTWLFDLPDDLRSCFVYAAQHGADYLCFDDGFDTISDLPTYEKKWRTKK